MFCVTPNAPPEMGPMMAKIGSVVDLKCKVSPSNSGYLGGHRYVVVKEIWWKERHLVVEPVH